MKPALSLKNTRLNPDLPFCVFKEKRTAVTGTASHSLHALSINKMKLMNQIWGTKIQNIKMQADWWKWLTWWIKILTFLQSGLPLQNRPLSFISSARSLSTTVRHCYSNQCESGLQNTELYFLSLLPLSICSKWAIIQHHV